MSEEEGAPPDGANEDRGPAFPAWFEEARFGLFVHWGPWSVLGIEPSWPLVGGLGALPHATPVTVDEYYGAARRFAPPPGAPSEWLELAARCGMDYAVLTTKHHDGFTLFPTEHSDLGIHVTAPGRDLVEEYVSAVRAAGLRLGFYYSLPDWHHPDYPAFRDDMRPYQAFAYPRPDPEAWARFRADQLAQLDHLLTAYGPVDLLWFDGGWERTPAEWGVAEIEARIRGHQPGIVVNDRLPGVAGYESWRHEQSVPFLAPPGPWETCLSMDESWGPLPFDAGRKPVAELVRMLADVAGRNGRMLVNVAPDAEGRLLSWQRAHLETVARWMERHRAAVHGTRQALVAGQFYGAATTDGDRLFLLCPMTPHGPVTLRAVRGARLARARVLGSDTPVEIQLRMSALDRLTTTDPVCDVVLDVPTGAGDPLVTVLEVEADPDRPGSPW